jgi:hypothetical protein
VIGENREDDKPKSVSTTADDGAFASGHMPELFNRAGLKTVDSDGAVTIKGEVRQFFLRDFCVPQSHPSHQLHQALATPSLLAPA